MVRFRSRHNHQPMPSLQRSVETPQSIYDTDWTATGTAGRLRSGDVAPVHHDLWRRDRVNPGYRGPTHPKSRRAGLPVKGHPGRSKVDLLEGPAQGGPSGLPTALDFGPRG